MTPRKQGSDDATRAQRDLLPQGRAPLGVARAPEREQLLKRLRAFRGRLPADFKFDRDDANAR